MKRGRFITIEGGEGAGKSTQAARLARTLDERGIPVMVTREPGGTAEAERIRALLLDPGEARWEAMTEVLLYFAGRMENVEKTVKPALANRCVVICDRFADSTLAYQGYGADASLAAIRSIADATLGRFWPDLTLILDIEPEEGLARTQTRSAFQDRYERQQLEFHRKVRKGFLEIAAKAPQRCVVIDAAPDEDRVAEAIFAEVAARFEETAG